MINHHRTLVFVDPIPNWERKTNVTSQFRYFVRLAYAMHSAGIPYEINWTIGKRATAVLECMCPGFVISHSSGLCLVRASETGEWEDDGSSDIRDNWMLTHEATGRGFGITGRLDRGAVALLFAAERCDWTFADTDLTLQAKRAGLETVAQFGRASAKDSAKFRLERLTKIQEQAA